MDLFRTKIRTGFERTGWSMNELSERAGMNRNALQQIMSGRAKNPRLDTIRQIAFALGDDPRTYLAPMTPREFFEVMRARPAPSPETSD
ncbi:helix-turn-helix domain-containing protein [Limimaricola variabilis]|uniref:helix-turn-helix domain-containing protein n=1 Tax=Limimaricola variabilis TaxID=1492771 RepID=UPI003CCDFF01